MAITIYKDENANAIFIEDANGVQFLNSLQATEYSTKCSVIDLARGIDLVTDAEYTDYEDQNGNPYGNDAVEVCNALNALFNSSGTPTENIPVITSPTSIWSVEGSVINYELTADFGVGYEWGNLPTGLTTVEGNTRKLIGGASLAAATYTPTMTAINYNGEDSKTLTITISNPPYANTKSVKFSNNQYVSSLLPFNLSDVLGRSGNGSGVSDAWTISLWFKPGTHTGGSKQTLFYFGGSDHDNSGHIWIYYKGSEQAIYLEYGSKNNYIRLKSSNNELTLGVWKQLLFTYDGGTTGSSSGSINDYYSRFSISINNVLQSTINSNGNFGWSSSINSDVFQFGKRAGGNDYLKNNCKLDEGYFFDIKQTEDLYNGGVPFDMSTLTDPPKNGFRFGDNDTYPILNDSFGSSALFMHNMTSSNIVNDVP